MAPDGIDAQVLRERTVDHISGGNAFRAHERISRTAMAAEAASARWIRCHYAVPRFEMSDKGSHLGNSAAELMSQHDWRAAWPKTFYDVDIRSTDPRSDDFKFHFVRSGRRFGPIGQLHVTCASLCFDDCFHQSL